ncbi:hypothetical protein K1Y77_12430 [Halomonas qaidamensis]|uniref:Uncharacterized protein n=1 Tax=Halomonas qaidamensis TaxID=2866211 RepID=A0ABY6JNR6_9GAMM|nr:hypothetical protein [Halomonas qaidamensis]UYV18285.1 hypothetical protein K1Y77_12430 [Halomonas qaidamensis]
MTQRLSKSALSPWQVVALESFQTPEQTQASQWRRSWRAATTWIIGKEASERQAKEESELRKLPEVALSHWVPAIDWVPAANALSQAMGEYADAPVVLFISPPYGGHGAVVSHWAQQQDVSCLSTPTFAELVDGCLEWVERCGHQRRWAIPTLERHFLRHSLGLQGVRELLERALSGRLGQGVIGCDSWTYAYLQHAVGLEGVPVVTLQALEGEQLAHYFTQLANDGGVFPTVYSSRTGRPILANTSEDDDERERSYKELQRLAAHCRGHLGIAWHYWRERLRKPVESCNTERSDEQFQEEQSQEELWLLDALAEAELPTDTGDVATLLLHALLIHGGLEDQALGHVLPFSHHEALGARLALARQEILSCHQGRWQVAPLSYASVRQLLESRNYLVDPL